MHFNSAGKSFTRVSADGAGISDVAPTWDIRGWHVADDVVADWASLKWFGRI